MLEATAPAEASAGESATTLWERERERESLAQAIARARRGSGGLLAIEGPAGIGKSALLAAGTTMAAEAGVTVLRSRASELERGFAYGVVRQLFEPVLRAADEQRRGGLLAGAAEPSGAILDPGKTKAATAADFGVLNGLYWLTAGLAEEGPLMVCIDDAQWADPASMRYASYLARRLQGVPALLCVATRPVDPSRGGDLLDGLLADARVSGDVLRPAPLSPAAATQLAGELLDDGAEPDLDFLLACHRASGGNPLLLRELCRGLRENGVKPATGQVGEVESIGGTAVACVVRPRLAQLPAEAGALASAAAVLGDRAGVAEAAALAGLEPDAGLKALDTLCKENVLVRGTKVEFVHPLVREAVIGGLGAHEAARAHAEAAQLLAAREAPTERVAEQILRATPAADRAWVETLRLAATAALGAGDGAAAVAYLRRALAEPPPREERLQTEVALAQAETLVDSPAAIARMEEILGRIEDRRTRATVAATLASHLPSWDPARTIEIGRAALRDLNGDHEGLSRHLEALVLTGELLVEEPDGRAGIEPRPASGDGAEARRLACLLGYREARANQPAAEVVPSVRAAFAGDWTRYAAEAGAQYAFGMLVLIAADHDDTLDLCEEWEAAGRRLGRVATWSGAKMFRAHALLARGELAEAAAEATDAVEAMEAYGMGGGVVSFAAAALADAQLAMGELGDGEQTIERARRAAGRPGAVNLHGLFLSRARLRSARGDSAGALAEMLDLGRRFRRVGGDNPALLPWRSEAALLASALDDTSRARELAEEEVALARRWGGPRSLGRALTRASAVAAPEERAPLLDEALAVLAAAPAKADLAAAELLAGVTARQQSPQTAREPLARALALASACGAGPLERRARAELVAVGARPRRSAVTGPEALTRRERQVAELAAAGRSNREVAQELYLTKRTVETHLTRVYRKLGIGSRAQLADGLNGGGPA